MTRFVSKSEGHRLTNENTLNGASTVVPIVDSSDGEHEEVESILLDHSNGSWWNMLILCKRVFRSHRFRNVQAEVLYQRYFLRMNQNNMASLLGLLIIISVTMIAINHISFPSSSSESCSKVDFVLNNNASNRFGVSDDSDSWFTTSDGGIVQGATLSVLILMYLLLLILMTKKSLNEVYLIIFSYIILASFFAIEVSFKQTFANVINPV